MAGLFVERTFTVDRPVAEVFAFLGDFTTTEQWDPGTRSTVRTVGDGGLGSVYRNVSEFMGRRVELRYETVTFRVDEEVQFRGQNGSAVATDWMRFSALDERTTQVHYRADFRFGPLLGLVAPLVIGRRLDALADETVTSIQRCLAT